jgi:hypothetical protein
MNYPHEFSTEAQSRVDAEEIRAARELDGQMQALPVGYAAYTEKREALVAHFILEVVWAFAKEAGALGRSRVWSITRIRSEVDRFLFQRELDAETKFHECIRGKIFSCHSKTRASGYLKTWFEESPRWKEYEDMLLGLGGEALARTSESMTSEGAAERDQGSSHCKSWEEIKISFLSDQRIQITGPKWTQTLNYAEFGFNDHRTGKPTSAWKALLILAKNSGPITEYSLGPHMKWSNFEKRM